VLEVSRAHELLVVATCCSWRNNLCDIKCEQISEQYPPNPALERERERRKLKVESDDELPHLLNIHSEGACLTGAL
jgi:hypothetical protein